MATVVVVMNKDFDGYKAGKQYPIELSLARRYIENKIAIPLSVHLDNEAAKKRVDEEAKKMKLLKAKDEAERETTASKFAKKRSKAIKK